MEGSGTGSIQISLDLGGLKTYGSGRLVQTNCCLVPFHPMDPHQRDDILSAVKNIPCQKLRRLLEWIFQLHLEALMSLYFMGSIARQLRATDDSFENIREEALQLATNLGDFSLSEFHAMLRVAADPDLFRFAFYL
jgi:hypothetical protein